MRIFRVIKKEGLKGFFKKWGEGIQRIPPEQLLRTEVQSIMGMILATVLAMGFFIFYSNLWPIALIMFFSIILQTTQLIGKWQQLKQLKKFEEQTKELQTILEVESGK